MQSNLVVHSGASMYRPAGYGFVIFILALVLFPFQWIAVGPTRLSLVATAVAALPALAFMMSGQLRLSMERDRQWMNVVLMTTCYLLSLTLGLTWSKEVSTGLSDIVRDAAYFSLLVLLYPWLSSIQPERLIVGLGKTVATACLAFVVFAMLKLTQMGINPITTFVGGVATGNMNQFQSVVYRGLFATGGAEDLVSATRHTIQLFFVCGIILCFLAKELETGTKRQFWNVLIAFLFVMVVTSISRQSVLAMVLSIAIMSLKSTNRIVLFWLLAAVFTAVVVFSSSLAEFLDKKFVEDVVENARLTQFQEAFEQIKRDPVRGVGTGETTSQQLSYCHNVVIHGWHQAGLPGLFSALLLTSYLIGLFFTALHKGIKGTGEFAFMQLGAAALLLMPLTRLMVGVRGQLDFSSIFALVLALVVIRSGETQRGRQVWVQPEFLEPHSVSDAD